jgi:hypothetical protein
MHRRQSERLKNEQIERPLQQARWRRHFFPSICDNMIADLLSNVKECGSLARGFILSQRIIADALIERGRPRNLRLPQFRAVEKICADQQEALLQRRPGHRRQQLPAGWALLFGLHG